MVAVIQNIYWCDRTKDKFTVDDLRDYEEFVSLNLLLLTLDNAYLNLSFGAIMKQKHVDLKQKKPCKVDKQTLNELFVRYGYLEVIFFP